MEAPPVVVKVVLLGLGPPYSTGYLNCFSAALLWEETDTIAFYKKISDDANYAGIKSETDTFIHNIKKYNYLFNLCDI